VQFKGLQVGFDLQYIGCTRSADALWPSADFCFIVLDWIFGLLFCFEALVKIVCFGLKYFTDPWNLPDLAVVCTFAFDKIATISMAVDKRILQLMRLFRLVRLFRLIETLEGLDILYIMTTSIKGVFWILAWAVTLLSVMLVTLSLFLTQVLHAMYFNDVSQSDLSAAELEKHHKLYEYFGSFTRCLMSMFELTLANWPPVTRLLAEEVSEWFMLLCVVHKLTIGFAVIGVINGVIMQETFKVAATDDMIMVRQKTAAQNRFREKMTSLFSALDHDGDGAVDFDEFEIISRIPEVTTWLAAMDIDTDDLPMLFSLIDADGSGTLPIEELVTRIPRVKGPARSIDMLAMYKLMCGGDMGVHPAAHRKTDKRPRPSASTPAFLKQN